MKVIVIFIITTCFYISCNRSTNDTYVENIEHISVLYNNQFVPVEEIIKEVKYVKLETNNSALIGLISKIVFTKDHIIIGDNLIANAIYMFDMNGRFIKKIGNIGSGPGEYTSFIHMTLTPDGKSIAVVDDKKSRIIYYDLNGDFLGDEYLPYRSEIIEYLDNDYLVFSNTPGVYKNTTAINNTLIISDKGGEILYSDFPSTYTNEFNLVTHSDHLKRYNEELYYNPNLSDSIYQISKEGISKCYVINVENCNRPHINTTSAFDDYVDFIQSNKCFNGSFVNMDKYLVIGLFPNGSSPVLYDKNKAEVYQINRKQGDPIFEFWEEGEIITSYSDDTIVLGMNAERVFSIYNNLSDENKANLSDLQVNKEDNPVLFFCSLRE